MKPIQDRLASLRGVLIKFQDLPEKFKGAAKKAAAAVMQKQALSEEVALKVREVL